MRLPARSAPVLTLLLIAALPSFDEKYSAAVPQRVTFDKPY